MAKGPDVAVTYPPAFEREEVDGLKVKRDEVDESPLSRVHGRFIPRHGIRKLTLEDDSVVYGCRDCEFTVDRPGKVRVHRTAEHGLADAGGEPKPAKRDGTAGQIRAPGADALSMTLHELLDQAGQIETYALAMDALDEENQQLRDRLDRERQAHREELAEEKRLHRATKREWDKLKKTLGNLIKVEG